MDLKIVNKKKLKKMSMADFRQMQVVLQNMDTKHRVKHFRSIAILTW